MRRALKSVFAALILGACMVATPAVLAFSCEQMFYHDQRICFLSGEDEAWCYYECY